MAPFAHNSSEKTTAPAGARSRRARRTVTGAVLALSLALGGLSVVSGLGDKLGDLLQPQGKSWASTYLFGGNGTPSEGTQGKSWASTYLFGGNGTPSEGTQGKSWAASVPAPPTTM